MTVFAERFSAVLRRRGLKKQKDAARFLEISQSMVSDYKQGKATPSFDVLAKIAEKLQVDVNELGVGVPAGTIVKMPMARESNTRYGGRLLPVDALKGLRTRWQLGDEQERAQIRLGLTALFDETGRDEMIEWLEEK